MRRPGPGPSTVLDEANQVAAAAAAATARPNRGRASRLTPEQIAAVTRAAAGKRVTTTRLAAWIERHFGVRYGRTQVWKLARRHGWALERARKETL